MVDGANLGGMEQGVHGVLGVELVEATKDRVVLRLEVGPAVHQPFGLLHGGVSALLTDPRPRSEHR